MGRCFPQVLKMDMHNHQPIIDSVLEAGRKVILSEGGAEATHTRSKLDDMSRKLVAVRSKNGDRRLVLEDALKDVNIIKLILYI